MVSVGADPGDTVAISPCDWSEPLGRNLPLHKNGAGRGGGREALQRLTPVAAGANGEGSSPVIPSAIIPRIFYAYATRGTLQY